MQTTENMPSRKKLYQAFIYEIVYAVSVDQQWRKKLFDAPANTRFRLDAEILKDTRGLDNNFLRNHKLVYSVWKAETVSQFVRFEFVSTEYPDVTHFSQNNSNT